MSFGDVYSGRKVFVTGHTGFKGAWLTAWLVSLGADVTGYALEPPTRPSIYESSGLSDRIHDVRADIRDESRLVTEMRIARPSVVFHLAAQPLVRRAYEFPVETFATNVMGTVNVLEAARGCDTVEAIVIVTSDKCYENQEFKRAQREDAPMGGRDPYSASKGAAELATAAYRSSFFQEPTAAAVASVRAGNVIGGGDWATDRIVPDCVRALVGGLPVSVRNPDAVRPWQHVLEPLSGYLHLATRLLADAPQHREPWNFGPTEDDADRPVRWVVENFIEEWGGGSWVRPEDGAHPAPHEAHYLSIDSAKARARLGWAPVWDAATAVRQTARWYRSAIQDEAAEEALVAEDIAAYTAAAQAQGIAWASLSPDLRSPKTINER